jgi:hypothetical protein
MSRRRKTINKKIKKLIDKKCYFCGENNYCVLDVHRILPGSEGGIYSEHNSVTACSNCHRKIHDGKIKLDRKYYSTKGWVLHYFDENQIEHWD